MFATDSAQHDATELSLGVLRRPAVLEGQIRTQGSRGNGGSGQEGCFTDASGAVFLISSWSDPPIRQDVSDVVCARKEGRRASMGCRLGAAHSCSPRMWRWHRLSAWTLASRPAPPIFRLCPRAPARAQAAGGQPALRLPRPSWPGARRWAAPRGGRAWIRLSQRRRDGPRHPLRPHTPPRVILVSPPNSWTHLRTCSGPYMRSVAARVGESEHVRMAAVAGQPARVANEQVARARQAASWPFVIARCDVSSDAAARAARGGGAEPAGGPQA